MKTDGELAVDMSQAGSLNAVKWLYRLRCRNDINAIPWCAFGRLRVPRTYPLHTPRPFKISYHKLSLHNSLSSQHVHR